MTNYLPGTTRTTSSMSNSYGQRNKSPKFMEVNDNDYSIFIGYGVKAKRIKDRWEATKRLLRFENNFVALKWLLDSFVDEYLRSKQMEDTMVATAETSRKERRMEETVLQGPARRLTATRSPPKTRFEEVPNERSENSSSIADRSSPSSTAETRPQSSSKDHKTRPGSDSVRMSSDVHVPGQYSYKYVPEYWSPYYHWPGGVAVNPRLVNVGSIPSYSGYMVKSPNCSSLPLRDTYRDGEQLKRSRSTTAVKEEPKSLETNEKQPAVNLGFKTKSMPNLQFIAKESECASEDEEDIESDPESQGDLIALSSSSLSMPNLHKIPAERPPLLSPPSRRRYEPRQTLRDRHDVCPSSSFSMPNLQSIHGVREDERKKTIRDFVMNRLTKTDGEQGNIKTKIFNPNGYYMSPRIHDSEKKLVKQDIRRRLLQRIEAKRQIEETHTSVSARQKYEKTSHSKLVNRLPKVSENKIWPTKVYADEKVPRTEARTLGKDENANNWKVPVSSVGSSDQMRNTRAIKWNDAQQRKAHGGPGIWNPADVHVKKESVSEESKNGAESAVAVAAATAAAAVAAVATAAAAAAAVATTNGKSPQAVSSKVSSSTKEDEGEEADSGTREEKENEQSSDDEEEHVDVETLKDTDETMDDSGGSESELADDMCGDGKRNKRTRKPDNPRKRLKAM